MNDKKMRQVLKSKCLVYSNVGKNSNKFYIASVEKDENSCYLVVKYGRLGRLNPNKKEYSCTNLSQAISEYENKIREKERKGYEETDIEIIMQSTGEFIY